ncbi:hypothetical protein [Saccharomonospora azurea]|uniref:hypothetical protein n=1 Tax=Saccharomonospora azurea TaxID=40988 RepID=UPI001E2AA6F4|nr:hypothetical protein [Saccharomonospora azurea]
MTANWGLGLAQEFSEQGAAYDGSKAGGGFMNAAAAVFGAATNAANMASARTAAGNLVDSAKNGGFTVSKDSANELIDTMSKFVDEIDAMDFQLAAFDQRPSLGGHQYGQLVAQHMHDAANDPNSARMVVKQLKEVLKLSIEALQRASGQYEETEANVVDAVNRTGNTI